MSNPRNSQVELDAQAIREKHFGSGTEEEWNAGARQADARWSCPGRTYELVRMGGIDRGGPLPAPYYEQVEKWK